MKVKYLLCFLHITTRVKYYKEKANKLNEVLDKI